MFRYRSLTAVRIARRGHGLALATALASFALVLGACSASGGSSATPTTTGGGAGSGTGRSAVITIQNFAFGPSTLRVAPGTQVTVENKDGVTHTLTSDAGMFDTGDISANGTAHFQAPAKAGSYPYRCNIHQFMTGTLVVT
ncbi:MAG: cupredoxin domain-containing protein [Acidimicrobiales bacterium]